LRLDTVIFIIDDMPLDACIDDGCSKEPFLNRNTTREIFLDTVRLFTDDMLPEVYIDVECRPNFDKLEAVHCSKHLDMFLYVYKSVFLRACTYFCMFVCLYIRI